MLNSSSREGVVDPDVCGLPGTRAVAPFPPGHRRSGFIRGVLIVLVASGAACSGSRPPTPTPTLFITCPASTGGESLDGQPIAIEYPPATALGGVPPVSVACTPASASRFPVGTTAVLCEARDAAGAIQTCSFAVEIRRVPQLSVTRFVAFGDSLTEGTVALLPTFLVVSGPQSYPFKLKNLLSERYRTQTFDMINEGEPGEQAVEGVQRLGSVLRAHRPEVLLLMQGSNDLFFFFEAAEARAIPALDRMVSEAQSQGVQVLLATIPPQRTGGQRDRVAALIPSFNDEIRALAARRNAVLVDVYQAIAADMSLIGADDLHLTGRGYDVVAETFFTAIRSRFEVTSQAVLSSWR
ncbi:MAG TPA: GDSL-type esterase/lipase family protein [Vicinamibacterales bacterium]|nr:GDSL-type esterase/lipase family protein [Vicinamibacterales bacterium]